MQFLEKMISRIKYKKYTIGLIVILIPLFLIFGPWLGIQFLSSFGIMLMLFVISRIGFEDAYKYIGYGFFFLGISAFIKVFYQVAFLNIGVFSHMDASSRYFVIDVLSSPLAKILINSFELVGIMLIFIEVIHSKRLKKFLRNSASIVFKSLKIK